MALVLKLTILILLIHLKLFFHITFLDILNILSFSFFYFLFQSFFPKNLTTLTMAFKISFLVALFIVSTFTLSVVAENGASRNSVAPRPFYTRKHGPHDVAAPPNVDVPTPKFDVVPGPLDSEKHGVIPIPFPFSLPQPIPIPIPEPIPIPFPVPDSETNPDPYCEYGSCLNTETKQQVTTSTNFDDIETP
jgi:hypothetical protein